VGAEHLLIALLREGEGVAAQVLVRLGADLDLVVDAVGDIPRRRPDRDDTEYADVVLGPPALSARYRPTSSTARSAP
jgi:hypothetical protein